MGHTVNDMDEDIRMTSLDAEREGKPRVGAKSVTRYSRMNKV